MFQSTHIQHKLYNWSMVGALNTSRSTGEDNSGEKISEESIGKESGEDCVRDGECAFVVKIVREMASVHLW